MDSPLWIGLDDLDLEEMLGERVRDCLGDVELLRSGDLSCFPLSLGATSSSLLDRAAVEIILSVGGELDRLRDLSGDLDLDRDLDLLLSRLSLLDLDLLYLSLDLDRLLLLLLLLSLYRPPLGLPGSMVILRSRPS